jgi:hypothetical protein
MIAIIISALGTVVSCSYLFRSRRHKGQDMERATLLQQVATQCSEIALLQEVKVLLKFIKDTYGVAMTLCRESAFKWEEVQRDITPIDSMKQGIKPTLWKKVVPVPSDVSDSRIKKTLSCKKLHAEPTSSTPSSTPPRAKRASIGQEEEEEEAVDNSVSAQEDRYLQDLDIVCTTENLTWGQGTTRFKADHNPADIEASMPARVLSEAVDEAFESTKLIQKGVLIVMPIFIPGSMRPWGTITSVNKMAAAGTILGGVLQKPLKNSVPSAMENVMLCAQAIARAMGKVEREDTVGGGWRGDPAVKIAQEVDTLNKKHCQYLDNFCVKQVAFYNQMFSELKSYTTTANSLKRTIISVLLYVGMTSELEVYLGPELDDYPEDDEELWAFARKSIILNTHHPKYVRVCCQGRST